MPEIQKEQIQVLKRAMPADYCMPYMKILQDYYNIGFAVSGDRKTVTPTETYEYHSGNVAMMAPHVYHRTFSISDQPYESYLIKFTPEFIEPLINVIGKNAFQALFEQHTFSFHEGDCKKIQNMFEDMYIEYRKEEPYKELVLQGMLIRLFTTIMETYTDNTYVCQNDTLLSPPILDIICYLETHYRENPTLREMSEMVSISEAHLSRTFRAQLGIPLSVYLSNIKIGHVQELLLKTDMTVSEIALETGFCNGDYLSASFKKKTGMTPLEFRKHQTYQL